MSGTFLPAPFAPLLATNVFQFCICFPNPVNKSVHCLFFPLASFARNNLLLLLLRTNPRVQPYSLCASAPWREIICPVPNPRFQSSVFQSVQSAQSAFNRFCVSMFASNFEFRTFLFSSSPQHPRSTLTQNKQPNPRTARPAPHYTASATPRQYPP